MSTLITTTAQIGTIKDAGGNATSMTIDNSGVITHAAGFNNYATASANNTTLIQPTLTDIPSWANEITVSFYGLSPAGAADTMFRAAVGGTVITANYQYVGQYTQQGAHPTHSDRSAGNDGGFAFYGWTAANNDMNGTVVFTKAGSTTYVVVGEKYNHAYTGYMIRFAGRVSFSGTISGISLYNSTNFDAGNVRVFWR